MNNQSSKVDTAVNVADSLPETMRRIRVDQAGIPREVMRLEHVPVPQPAADEVLIRVEAVGVNFADGLAVADEYLSPIEFPFTPGVEFVGRVVALGENVKEIPLGERFAALTLEGGLSEYACVETTQLIPVPPHWTNHQAAAMSVSYLTSFFALSHADVGEWVMVQGAAGALGSASIGLAKVMGLKVAAVASTPEKVARALELGADIACLESEMASLLEHPQIKENGGLDVILEIIGGQTLNKRLEWLAPFGRMILIGNASREDVAINPMPLMYKDLTVTGLWLAHLMNQPRTARRIPELFGLIVQHEMTPQVGSVYSLEEAPTAFHDLLERRTMGKVIVEVAQES